MAHEKKKMNKSLQFRKLWRGLEAEGLLASRLANNRKQWTLITISNPLLANLLELLWITECYAVIFQNLAAGHFIVVVVIIT